MLAALAAVAVIAGPLTAPTSAARAVGQTVGVASASAASPVRTALAGFTPGSIIDDGVFFNAATMTEADIQRFLEARVPSCQSGYTCLKDWRDTSRTVAADAMCGAYSGASDERAARIIYKVAQACGINPQVILATLQKEQGLVTHTWPSDWRYRIAMGQGCPDTAACDTRYYGFFNQVYGAAWQFKRYANPPGTSKYFTWYAPGNTWNIRYNPNADCGSSRVFVANQATSNLYYYTPYQPNAAAMAAGTGTGDACSAYGNRNFYHYFTEWFGTTRGSGVVLARTSADAAVFLLSGGRRWHVTDGDDLTSLSSVFGQVYVVSDTYLNSFSAAGRTGAALRDESTGEIAYFQDGKRHRFASCDLVQRWVGDCAAPAAVPGTLFQQAPAAEEMTAFYRVRGSSQWGRLDSPASATPMYDEKAARAANGAPSTALYAAYISGSVLATRSKSPLLFAPLQVVKASNSDKVYLTLDQTGLAWIRDWKDVAEYNRSSSNLAVVAPGDLAGYKEAGDARRVLRCDSTTFFPGSGTLYPLPDPQLSGVGAAMQATALTCAQLPTGPAMGRVPLISVNGSDTVAAIEAGNRRVVSSWRALVAYMDGTATTVAKVSPASYASLPAAAPVADGDVVKGSGATLSLVSGTTAIRVPSYDLANDGGLSLTYSSLPDAEIARLTQASSPLGVWVTCNGATHVIGSGAVTRVAPEAAAGFTPQPLSAVACSKFGSRTNTLSKVFVKSSSSSAVLVAQDGVFRHVQSWETLQKLSGGDAVILTLSPSTVASLPQAAPLP